MSEAVGFATADYAVFIYIFGALQNVKNLFFVGAELFIAVLVLASLIGIYQGINDRKVKNVDNYQFGNRKMSPVAVGLSLGVSYISAITLVGFPADAYLYGTVNMWYTITGIIAPFIACLYYIPLMRKLKLQTMNEYLEYRFNSKVRKFVSFYTIFQDAITLGVIIYLPPLAISALTPLSFDASILITAGVVTLYTTVGGFKAVIWTDSLQSLVMLVGAIATFIRAVIVVGGFGEVWDAAERGGRINHWDFNLDPTLQRTFWTISVGYSMTICASFCYTQPSLQRYQSCKSLRDARIVSIVGSIPFAIFFPICLLTGYVSYAYFENCDPYLNGEIQEYDQLIPLLVSEIFRDAPGMTGLFVAAIYCGTLSTLSSGINSIGTLIIQDIILPCYPRLSQIAKLTLSKILALCIGLLAAAIGFAFQFVEGNFVPIAVAISGSFAGPTLGLFTLALFFPWTNATGVVTGTLVALGISSWTAIGALLYGNPPEKVRELSGSIQNCLASNDTFNSTYFTRPLSFETSTSFKMMSAESTSQLLDEKPYLYYTLYSLSYQYYIVLGFIVFVLTAIPVSFLTKPNSPPEMDPRLFVPLIDNKRLPEKVRKFFRFGVPKELATENFNEKIGSISLNKKRKNSRPLKCSESVQSDDDWKITLTRF